MPVILLALVVLAVVAFGIFWFLRANPSTLARLLRPILVVLGGIGIGGMLIFGLRFLPGLLPELFGLAGVVITALIARAVAATGRPAASARRAAGQRTEVRTAFLQAWIDHGTGDVGGTVLSGRFVGPDARQPGATASCSTCMPSARPMPIRCGSSKPISTAGWARTGARRVSRRRGPRTDMTRDEALAVLGLAEGASEDEIQAAHRRLIQRMHPDVGGSADLAARINRAKDVLLGG